MRIKSKFRPAWWLRNAHAQTIWGSKFRRRRKISTIRERIDTADGDFLDLDWTKLPNNKPATAIVVVFHGLAGSLNSSYVGSVLNAIDSRGLYGILMHFRSCSEEPNRLPTSYHSGHTCDIRFVIDTLRRRHPNTPLFAVGYSLGGNALLKYLAQQPSNPLSGAVSVSPPLVLAECAKRLNSGFSRLYQQVLLTGLKATIKRKLQRYPGLNSYFPAHYKSLKTFWDFDNQITAPLHGYRDVHDYYTCASSRQDLINIKTTTHILFAQDDPFFTPKIIPSAAELSPQVTFELAATGGHVGFISGAIPLLGQDWLTHRITEVLCNWHVATAGQQ